MQPVHKLTRKLACSVLLAALSLVAEARDDRLQFPVSDALASVSQSGKAEAKFDSDVKLYFSGQPHPKAAETMGTFTANKKTNFFNKSDKEGCEWAFLSAAISLQERAKKEGGNAVIDIYSIYKKDEFKSATEYVCGAGAIMGGVALRGTVVKLK